MNIKEESQKNTNVKEHKTTIKKLKRQVKGITLIALVVTIIVLLILAGVSIATLTGDNGILTRAQEAKVKTEEAEEVELRKLTQAEAATHFESYEYIDENEDKVIIPAEFAVSQVEGENTVDDGLVIIDSKGNEFVWVPVNIDNYVRIDFGIQAGLYSTYHETLSDIESESIQKYGGYYIGRYEAGDYESTHNRTYRDENSSSDNTISIRRGQVPYNYISVEQAIILSNDMKEKQGYSSVNTRLCSSYAYDAAVTFISKVEKNYALSSPQGNYKDRSFKYIDIDGEEKEKEDGDGILVPTGLTTSICNIYDLGGNVWELSSEAYSPLNQPVSRGGGYGSSFNDYPAGFRNTATDVITDFYGFRVCLFLE